MKTPNKYRVQEPPFTIKLELCEGCNLRCAFCGLQGIRAEREKNYKFMTPDNAAHIAAQVAASGWRTRWEFTMHGEPTMNPAFVQCIAQVRSALPRAQLMLTSNGGGLLRRPGPVEQIRDLFNRGLNILALDDYEGANIVPKIREALRGLNDPLEIPVYEFPTDPRGSPYKKRDARFRMITIMRDIAKTQNSAGGVRAHLSNHCGAAAPLNERMAGKRCARPFRELAIRWDGNVGLCCNDWRGAYKCGNVLTQGVEAVWQGLAMNAARRKLYAGQRDFGPCRGCDSHSYRLGLLPDPAGKARLPRANPEDARIIAAACAPPSYTAPVLREWEKMT